MLDRLLFDLDGLHAVTSIRRDGYIRVLVGIDLHILIDQCLTVDQDQNLAPDEKVPILSK